MKFAIDYVVTEHLSTPAITTRRYTYDNSGVTWTWRYEGPHPDPKFPRDKTRNAVTRTPWVVEEALAGLAPILLSTASITRADGHPRRTSTIDLRATVDGKEHHLHIDGPSPDAAHPCPHTAAVDQLVSVLDRLLRA